MKRRGALIGVVAACALAFAACGGGGGGGEASVSIKTLQAAVSNTQDAPSSRFTLSLGVSSPAKNLTIEGSGVASGDGKTMQVTLKLPIVGSIEERLIDGVIYVDLGDLGNLGDLSGKLPEGKRWISVSLEELRSKTGTDLSSLFDQAQNGGPTQGLQYLEGLSGDVTKVGDDTVAGEHATHYRASIDYSKVAAKLPDSSPLAGKLGALGTVPADVWINDQDRVVKMNFAIDGGALGGRAGTAEFSMEITDFGVPVDVQAPPADETVDFSDILGFHQAGEQLQA
jgi:hypothetical protein